MLSTIFWNSIQAIMTTWFQSRYRGVKGQVDMSRDMVLHILINTKKVKKVGSTLFWLWPQNIPYLISLTGGQEHVFENNNTKFYEGPTRFLLPRILYFLEQNSEEIFVIQKYTYFYQKDVKTQLKCNSNESLCSVRSQDNYKVNKNFHTILNLSFNAEI